MKAAQELYEGIDVAGMGAVGLITYMRTDSLRISDEAKAAAADLIKELYGAEYLPEKPRVFKSKNNAQDAHEAIRPTTVSLTPDKVKASLSSDQYKLYKLIWERFMASQMQNAVLDTVAADITAAGCLFKSSGYSVKFDGFTKLYEETKDADNEQSGALPKLERARSSPRRKCSEINTSHSRRHATTKPPSSRSLRKRYRQTVDLCADYLHDHRPPLCRARAGKSDKANGARRGNYRAA